MMMRILLLSPLRDIDPPCGDIVYTESLLGNPPPGVVYETYADALARGALVEHACRSALYEAWRIGRNRWLETWTTALSKITNSMRAKHYLVWEPFRIFSVRAGEYDLIHVHVFSCGFRVIDCPVVVSNALSLRYLYTDARSHSLLRIALMEKVDRVLAAVLGVNLTSYWLPGIERVIAFSQDLARWYLDRGIVTGASLDVVPIYLPALSAAPPNMSPRRIGFIAKDFDAKGGVVLLAAFKLVRRQIADAELVIVGSPARLDKDSQTAQGISWLPLVPREDLLTDIFPSLDVFAYPTQFDGMPLVLLEAMSFGVAIAATNYRAIPEMLDHGRAGLLSPVGDASALAANLIALLDPEINQNFRVAAHKHFLKTYSVSSVAPLLSCSYESAIQGSEKIKG